MITAEELKNLADDELDALSLNVEKELTRRKNRRTREAVKQARALLAAAGFEAHIYPIGGVPAAGKAEAGKGKLPAVPAGVYRNPENPDETWTAGGRGRMPSFVRDALAAGEDVSAWRIDEAKEEQPE